MNRRRSEPSQWSDADLVSACREGDSRAWRALVDRYRRLVYGIPRSLGLQAADAEDVFQQTFAGLWRALPGVREASRVGAWLATTSKRHAIRHLRDERRRGHVPYDPSAHEHAASAGLDPAAAVERLQARERLRAAVDELGDPCRSLLLGLFADHPKSYRSLAADVGLAIGSLGSARARCLERLRRRFLRIRDAAKGPGPSKGGSREGNR